MKELCMIIKDMAVPDLPDIRTSLCTYDKDALCCGAPCRRWAYHAIRSADDERSLADVVSERQRSERRLSVLTRLDHGEIKYCGSYRLFSNSLIIQTNFWKRR